MKESLCYSCSVVKRSTCYNTFWRVSWGTRTGATPMVSWDHLLRHPSPSLLPYPFSLLEHMPLPTPAPAPPHPSQDTSRPAPSHAAWLLSQLVNEEKEKEPTGHKFYSVLRISVRQCNKPPCVPIPGAQQTGVPPPHPFLLTV